MANDGNDNGSGQGNGNGGMRQVLQNTEKAFGLDLKKAKRREQMRVLAEGIKTYLKKTSIRRAVVTSAAIGGLAFGLVMAPSIGGIGRVYIDHTRMDVRKSNVERELLKNAVAAVEKDGKNADKLFKEARSAVWRNGIILTKSRAESIVAKTAEMMRDKQIKDAEAAVKVVEKIMKIDEETALKLAVSGYSDPEITTKLLGAMDSKSWQVRRMSALTLGVNKASSTVPQLVVKLMNDEDHDVRAAIAFALGEIGDKYAVAALIDRLQNDKSEIVKLRAATALGKLGDKSALPALQKALNSGQEWQCNMIEQEAVVAIRMIEGQQGKK